jgi:Phage tail protein
VTAPNPAATMPPTTLAQQYRMGPLFTETPGIDFWWNTQLADGSYTIVGEPIGWEGAEYLLPLDQVGGKDGAHTGPQSLGPRVLDCSALIVSPTALALRTLLQQMRKIFGPQGVHASRQPIIWEQHDFASGQRLALVTRPSGRFVPRVLQGFSLGGNAAEISFTLIAATPFKYQSGSTQSAEVGLFDPSSTTGRTYDKTYNWTYGAGGNPGGEMVVVNNGDTLSWPIFTVTGQADFPIITNVTSGQDFQLFYDLATLEVVTINSSTGEVQPGSVRLIGRPFPLLPGPNTIRWRTQSGAFHSEARLRLEWRSTFS